MSTFTIMVKSINVNEKIEINVENLNFHEIEERIYLISLKLGRRMLEGVLQVLDDCIREGRPRKLLENRGKERKYLFTKMGDILYKRTRYEDKSSGGYRYLLDEALGLEKRQTVSLGRRRLEAMTAVTAKSYRGAEDRMEELTGCSRSHESIRGVVLHEGKRLGEADRRLLQRVYRLEDSYDGDSHDVVYVEVDGTGIKHQRCDRKKGKGLEVKVGICYTGKRRRYRGGSGKAKLLENKYVHLDITSGSEFMEEMSLVAESEVGLSSAKHVIVGGDGDLWIRSGIEINFPGAVYKLCAYHLNKHITEALSGMKRKQRRVKSLLQNNDVDGALAVLWDISVSSNDKARSEKISDLYGYIRDNRSGITDLSTLGNDDMRVRIEKTGAIENTVDKAVSHRFKKRGFRWSERGARSLLKVEQAIINGRWDSWWEEDRDKVIKVNIEDVQPLSACQVNKGNEKSKKFLEEIELPCFRGPHQSRHWVKALKGLIEIEKL